MSDKDEALLKRLLATFRPEALEHIQGIGTRLVELERTTSPAERASLLDATFRSAHSLKGAARAVNAAHMEGVCQEMESVFAAMKRGELGMSPELFDLLQRAVDLLTELLAALDAPGNLKPERVAELRRALRVAIARGVAAEPAHQAEPSPQVTEGPAPAPAPAAEPARTPVVSETAETVRVATAKLDAVLRQAEEMIAVKLGAAQRTERVRRLQTRSAEWRKRWVRLQSDMRALRQAHDAGNEHNGPGGAGAAMGHLLEFLEWNDDFLQGFESDIGALAKLTEQDQRTVANRVDGLLDEMREVVIQPFSTLIDVLPRFVREQSREQRKDVELVIRGAEIGIDRRVLDQLKDPLMHLVRNSLDHGFETPAVREARGKKPRGTLTIEITSRNGSHVSLAISDDGAGIDSGRVTAAAASQRLLPVGGSVTPSAADVMALIFQPGLSTAPIVTDLSGRGLGLAIVKEHVEQRLGGAITVESTPGRGTTFRLSLPVTLARSRGVVVRVAERLFIVPVPSVERTVRVRSEDIKTVENRETVVVAGATLALARLAHVLGLPPVPAADAPAKFQAIVVLGATGQRIAFAVDEIVSEQEVLVKGLGPQLARVRHIAGATVLGAGKVVPILNVPDLMKSAVRTATGPARPEREGAATERPAILVAEDSITSRSLLKSILEAAGYRVETAVDGVDAFTKLRAGEFKLVVSDVDMPRMNGFGLTAKIRADKKLGELPVVLVTALDSRADREHGVDVGASAYIVKSSFDQTNLLDVIRRFL